MELSKRGLELIKRFEQCRLKAYPDSKGIPTLGWGHTFGVKLGMECTQAQADKWLAEDVEKAVQDVNKLVKVPLTQNQFDSLVSFTYNCGSDIDADTIAEGLGDSTLLKLLNQGDYEGAANQFTKWVKCAGKTLAGLVVRRKAEQTLFRERA